MLHRQTHRVEKDEEDDEPVEPLLLDGAADKEADALLTAPEVLAASLVAEAVPEGRGAVARTCKREGVKEGQDKKGKERRVASCV